MIKYLSIILIPAFILFSGCKDNPVEVHEDHELTAELTISPDHVHTLGEITYTVTVKNDHGEVVTDLQTVEVQRKGHGDTEWRGTELSLSGNTYSGTYTFKSSGDYDIRVTGMREGNTEMETLYEMDEHMHVGRAHEEVGSFRIEYENFPGHVHDGDKATVKFWVFESEKDANGDRPPVSGLDLHFHCNNPDGTNEHHTTVTEESSGVYVADHTFIGEGDAIMGMHFNDQSNTKIEAQFEFHVAGGH